MKNRIRLAVAFLLPIAAMLLIAATPPSRMDYLIAQKVLVQSLGLTVTGNTVVDDITVGDDATVADDLNLVGDYVTAPQTAITVTNGAAFTPTGTLQPIQSAGTVTPTIAIPTAGKSICIYNVSATTINIADTGNQVLTAAFAIGQRDVLCGFSDGTRFIERSRANN